MKEKLENMDKKKILIVVGFLVLIIVILFGGAFLYNKFFYKRTYSEVEEIMVNAAKSYYTKNSSDLPKEYNEVASISVERLVSLEEMKTIHEYLKDESVTCDGTVTVTNINGTYRYTPALNCGESYQTTKFIDYIKEHVPVVTEGTGLYELNNELVYRGDDVDNYLKFNNRVYRIVKFSNESAVIIYTDSEKLNDSEIWDDRYNVERSSTTGINDYSVSRVKEYLEELYEGTRLISEDRKLLVVAHNLAIGKRSDTDSDKTGSLENSSTISNQFIGLLPFYDYLNASLDKNCTSTNSQSCMNYNYLAKYKSRWWSMTATTANSYKVYCISSSGQPMLATPNSSADIRPVLYLTKEALYVSGNGTKDKPYILK